MIPTLKAYKNASALAKALYDSGLTDNPAFDPAVDTVCTFQAVASAMGTLCKPLVSGHYTPVWLDS